MSTITIRDERLSGVTMLPDDFVDHFMLRANGDYVKVYVYLLRCVHGNRSAPTVGSLADAFHLTERDIRRALTYWQDAGLLELKTRGDELESIVLLPLEKTLHETQRDPLLEEAAAETAAAAGEPAQISSGRLKELRSQEDARSDVKNILFIAQQYLGHPLPATDIRRILYLYDELHMSVDLIDFLIEYCVGRGKTSMHYIMKVGLAWYDDGITTVKEAKARNNLSMKNYYTIFKFFGISNRSPVPGEIADMDRWMNEYKFPMTIIEEAASRTIRSTGKPSFPYAERILSDWYRAGVRRSNDIAALDEKHKADQKAVHASAGGSARKNAGKFSNFPQRDDEEHRRMVEAVIRQQ